MKNMSAWGKAKAKERTEGYKRGGHVKASKVNININPPSHGGPPLPPPLPPAGPMGTPGAPPGGPPVPPPGGAGPFAKGGKVMKAGADSGPGRIEKGKWYGG